MTLADILALDDARAGFRCVCGTCDQCYVAVLSAEVKRLRAALSTANDSFEKTERELYIRLGDQEIESERLADLSAREVAAHAATLSESMQRGERLTRLAFLLTKDTNLFEREEIAEALR